MAKLTTEEAYQRYRSGMANAGERIRIGVERTTKSQTANAIKQKDKMRQNVVQAIDSGSWEKGLRAAGDEKWKNNIINKGLGKITTGIDANEAEIKSKIGKVLEVGDMVQKAVQDMPKTTLEDSVARSRMAMTTAKKAWGKTT